MRSKPPRHWKQLFALLVVGALCLNLGMAGQATGDLIPRPVLKLVIDHPILAKYLHPEVPGRVPLVVSDHLLAPGVTPGKFGQPVQVVPDREVGTRPHLRFLSFEVKGSAAKLKVKYEVESVEATFRLESNTMGWWKVVDAKIIEY